MNNLIIAGNCPECSHTVAIVKGYNSEILSANTKTLHFTLECEKCKQVYYHSKTLILCPKDGRDLTVYNFDEEGGKIYKCDCCSGLYTYTTEAGLKTIYR